MMHQDFTTLNAYRLQWHWQIAPWWLLLWTQNWSWNWMGWKGLQQWHYMMWNIFLGSCSSTQAELHNKEGSTYLCNKGMILKVQRGNLTLTFKNCAEVQTGGIIGLYCGTSPASPSMTWLDRIDDREMVQQSVAYWTTARMWANIWDKYCMNGSNHG